MSRPPIETSERFRMSSGTEVVVRERSGNVTAVDIESPGAGVSIGLPIRDAGELGRFLVDLAKRVDG